MVSEELIDEIRQAFVEGEFSSRWTLVEAYHQVGLLINSVKKDRNKLLHELSPRVGKSVRTLWYAAKFADVFPDLDKLPEGKNTSMEQIKNKYLVTKKQEECLHKEEEVEIVKFKVCKGCGKKLGKV